MKNLATVAQAFERPLPTGEKPEEAAARAKTIERQAGDHQARSPMSCGPKCSPTPGPTSAIICWRRPMPGPGRRRPHGGGQGAGARSSSKPRSTRRGPPTRWTRVRRGDRHHPELRAGRTRGPSTRSRSRRRASTNWNCATRPCESRPVKRVGEGKVVLPEAAEGDDRRMEPGTSGLEAGGQSSAAGREEHGRDRGARLLPHIDKLAVLPLEPMEAADRPVGRAPARSPRCPATQADRRVRHRAGRTTCGRRRPTTRSSARG